MELSFTIFRYAIFGLFGFVGLLFVLALIFGKRIVKQWEFEAEFRDGEFGEFDIELSHVAKKETADTFKAEFRFRHPTLDLGLRVQVFLDDILVLEGPVETAGRIYLTSEHIKTELNSASAGQLCRVVYGGQEQFSQSIVRD